ncbi:MAG: response regulator [Lachnospiraceae bacterium]|nr:response regulator [Lachnospiraceae bacterium]
MKDKIQILLIEDNQEKRLEFRTALQLHENMVLCGETGSEKEALSLLNNRVINVVILDLELEEGNGIRFAETMRGLSVPQPFVVVTTNNCSSSVLQYLRSELKVDFIFQKTNISYTAKRVLDIISKVYKYHQNPTQPVPDEKELLKNRIRSELQNMGFSLKHTGTDYLVDIFLFLSEHPDDSLQVSKIIYPAIAKSRHTDPANVERAVRTAIERTWDTANLMTLSQYYPYDVRNKNGRPSNGEFIAKMRLKFFGK